MTSNYNSGKPSGGMHSSLPAEYIKLIRSGYFDEKEVIKEQYLWKTTKELTKGFRPGQGLTSTQLRNFYNHVKLAGNTYGDALSSREDQDKAGRILLIKVRQMDSLIHNAKSKQESKIPDTFFEFIKENVQVCKMPEDVMEGFIPHFQAVLGYFKYYEAMNKNQKQRKWR